MPQTATIKRLLVAFAMLKAMQAEGVQWVEDYRGAAQQALAELLEGRIAETIDRRLERTTGPLVPASPGRDVNRYRSKPRR